MFFDNLTCRGVSNGAFAQSARHDFLHPSKRPTTDEQDVASVDRDELLFWMLAPSLRWNLDVCSFEQLQESLLNAFAADVPCDGRIVTFAGNLVDFIDEDNASFGRLNIEIGGLKQPRQDAFHIFPYVASLREHGCIGDAKWDIEHAGDGFCQQGLSRTSFAHQNHVALVQFNL